MLGGSSFIDADNEEMGYIINSDRTVCKLSQGDIDTNFFLKLYRKRKRLLWYVRGPSPCVMDGEYYDSYVGVMVFAQRLYEEGFTHTTQHVTFQNFMEILKGVSKEPEPNPKPQNDAKLLKEPVNPQPKHKKCHVCNQSVQTKHVNAHLQSASHNYAVELTNYIMNRATKHMTDPLLATTPQTETTEHYCPSCDVEMPKTDIDFHNLTFTHRSAVYKTELMQNLLAYYEGEDVETKPTSDIKKSTAKIEPLAKKKKGNLEEKSNEKHDEKIAKILRSPLKQKEVQKELENRDTIKEIIAEYKSFKNKQEEERSKAEALQELIIQEPKVNKKKKEPKVIITDKTKTQQPPKVQQPPKPQQPPKVQQPLKPQQPLVTQTQTKSKKNVVPENVELNPNQKKDKHQTVTKTLQKTKAQEQAKHPKSKKDKKANAKAKANNKTTKAKAIDETTFCLTCQVPIAKGSYDVHVLKKRHMRKVVMETQNKANNTPPDESNSAIESPKHLQNNKIHSKVEIAKEQKHQKKEIKETANYDAKSENLEKDFLEAVERLTDSINGERGRVTPCNKTDEESGRLQIIFEEQLLKLTSDEKNSSLSNTSNIVPNETPPRTITGVLNSKLLTLFKDTSLDEKEMQKLLDTNPELCKTDQVIRLFDFYRGENSQDFATYCRACNIFIEDCLVGWLRHAYSDSHINVVQRIMKGEVTSDASIHKMRKLGNGKLYCFTCEKIVMDNPESIMSHLCEKTTE